MKRDPKASAKAVNAFAYRVLRRVQAAGDRSIGLEDIKGELWIAWCLACDAYDSEKGVPWEPYFQNGMRLHINRFVEKNVTRRHDEVTSLSLDYRGEGGESEGSSISDIVPSDAPLPSEAVEQHSHVEFVLKRLTTRAAQFVTILREQPIEILNEVRCVAAKAHFMREKGQSMSISTRLTSDMVFTLMGASTAERGKITTELREIGARVERLTR